MELIIKHYSYFFSKLTGYSEYDFIPSEREIVMMNNFLKIIEKDGVKVNTLGDYFWFDYFCFQFDYWKDKYTRLGKNKVSFNWVVGKEAYKRWLARNDNWKYFCERGFINKFNINKQELLEQRTTTNYCELVYNEEQLKKMFHTSPNDVLANCLLMTTLFNSKSEYCLKCNFKQDCELLLKVKYFKIYKQRNAIKESHGKSN